MAGSLKNFVYTTDASDEFFFKADESNLEAVNGIEGDYTDTSTTVLGLPRNIKMRTVRYSNDARTVNRTIVVVNPTIFADIVAGNTAQTIDVNIEGATFTLGLVETRGEVFTRPTPVDTGLTDGDPT